MSKIIKVVEEDLEVTVTPWEYLNRFLKSILDDYLNHNEKKFTDREEF